MRTMPLLLLLALAGCGGSFTSYQPAPRGVPEEVNAYCNLVGAQAAASSPGAFGIGARANCLRFYLATGMLPGAVTAVR